MKLQIILKRGSHVVSLRREDAIRLGYDNSERWRELVMRHIADIAEQTKIPLCNLKWYAAFHDTNAPSAYSSAGVF